VKLYLLRHGPAVERRVDRPDFDRPLTERGRRRMRRIARALRRAGVEVEAIYSSPLVRCLQTAEAVVAELPGAPSPGVEPGLAPEGRIDELLREIAARHRAARATIVLVGHEPDLGRLLSVLLTGDRRSAFRFRKGGICLLDVPAGRLRYGRCATLEWFATPRLLLGRRGPKRA
jgi:phosphohistidine phosphatase